MFISSCENLMPFSSRTTLSSTHAGDISGLLQHRTRGTLLKLANWDNGTVVEESALSAGNITELAPANEGRATLVMVCLDDCSELHLLSRDGSKRARSVKAGSVFLFDLQAEHHLRVETDLRVICFGVDFKVLDQLARRSLASKIDAAPSRDAAEMFFIDATVHGLATSARSALQNPNASSGLFLEQVTCAVAAHLLLRLGAAHARLAGSGGLAPWQLAKAKKMVSANLGRALQAHELAEACGLSPSHFSRAFRCSTGTSPHAWLVNQRVFHAKQLMRTSDAPLAQIALECGFADQSHFTRVFTREEGNSPGSWRRCLIPAGCEVAA